MAGVGRSCRGRFFVLAIWLVAISRTKKEEIVEKVTDKLKKAAVVTFVNFTGLTASETAKLRQQVRAIGAGFTVVKKTLLGRALKTLSSVGGEAPSFDGEVAVAYWFPAGQTDSEDVLALARGLHQFGEESGHIKLTGGIFEGGFISAAEINELARIPSRQVLYAGLLGMFSVPERRLVFVLDQLAKSKQT